MQQNQYIHCRYHYWVIHCVLSNSNEIIIHFYLIFFFMLKCSDEAILISLIPNCKVEDILQYFVYFCQEESNFGSDLKKRTPTMNFLVFHNVSKAFGLSICSGLIKTCRQNLVKSVSLSTFIDECAINQNPAIFFPKIQEKLCFWFGTQAHLTVPYSRCIP